MLRGENGSTRRKPVPVPPRPPKIAQRLAWDQTRAFAEGGLHGLALIEEFVYMYLMSSFVSSSLSVRQSSRPLVSQSVSHTSYAIQNASHVFVMFPQEPKPRCFKADSKRT
jgi:hypothetical protein